MLIFSCLQTLSSQKRLSTLCVLRTFADAVLWQSVSSQFSAQLTTLRFKIDKTVPHYVRCSKHKDKLAPDYFEPKNIVEQLRCGRVVESVRVSRAGYPSRYTH